MPDIYAQAVQLAARPGGTCATHAVALLDVHLRRNPTHAQAQALRAQLMPRLQQHLLELVGDVQTL